MSDLFQSVSVLLTILTPLVAVPLTVITFYLRSLREHQLSRYAELARRIEQVEGGRADMQGQIKNFERDYATKEEWLRECMGARRTLEQLTQTTVRIETLLENTALTTGWTSRAEGRRGGHPPVPRGPDQVEDAD